MEQYVRANFTNGAWHRRRWLTIFPEGGFKYKRVANSRRFAEKNNLPDLEHCTYPRHFGIHTATKVVYLFFKIFNIFKEWRLQIHARCNHCLLG